jgi:uncharacterized hydantoinase/oxoprolinase family protein
MFVCAVRFACSTLRVRKAMNLVGAMKHDLEETMKELRYFGRLRHPAIVKLFDLVIEGKFLNVIREYCEVRMRTS